MTHKVALYEGSDIPSSERTVMSMWKTLEKNWRVKICRKSKEKNKK